MSQDKSDPKHVLTLFASARADGALSATSYQALTTVDLGAQIQAGLGISVDDVQASEVVLLTMMPDDSGSMGVHTDAVCEGHNLVLDALRACQQRDAILAHTRYLNGDVLFPYRPLDQAARMDRANYCANKGTPLYDQSVVLLGSVMAKARELEASGVVARSVTLILTDGADCHSVRAKARDVASLVHDLTRIEGHIVAAMGIADGGTDFRTVFRNMGIDDRWILTPANDAGSIRKAFQMFSQSAVRVSQAKAPGVSLGGFGG
ncbi:MAG TPA: hypothetical protein VGI39_06315 [Polyangiaceae bacterium]|jgi:hypothetical protein